MENIIEYIENNMHVMAEKAFNAVDSLVLSKLSYIRFEQIIPGLYGRTPVRIGGLLRAELFHSMFQNMREIESNRRFLYALAASPRYRNIQMNHYVNKTDPESVKQFSAVTFLLEDNTAYIAYRGTDATFVGWKEDFNMAYLSPIPSQEEAVKYLNAVAKRLPRKLKIRVGGHSKGGNLAVYSAVKCDPSVQKRIMSVFNHDGPGFKESMIESSEFMRIKDRIHTTLPEESLVGMLLQHHEDYRVVKSSRRGIMQHEPFTWYVEGNDFFYADSVKSGARLRNKTLNDWLDTLTDEKRKMIVDLLFQVLETADAENFIDLSDDWRKSAVALLGAVKNIDPESKKFVSQTINELAKLSIKNVFKPRPDEHS